ncbi:hypothetical protein ACFUTV_23400 [Streptomyces sp. NPDC057298]
MTAPGPAGRLPLTKPTVATGAAIQAPALIPARTFGLAACVFLKL